MKRSVIAAVAAVLLLTLTGCAGATDAAPSEPQAAAQTVEETPAPLVAEKTAPANDSPEAVFLEKLRAAFERDGTSIPNATDEQLLDAAERACEQLTTGTAAQDVRVIDGETAAASGYFVDSMRIAAGASEYLCG